MSITYKTFHTSIGLIVFLASTAVWAFPFQNFDARTAAMGGVGFAWDARNAAYYNPALIAASPAEYNWVAITPGIGNTQSVDTIQSSLDDISNGVGNRDRIIDKIMGKTHHQFDYRTLMLAVPSDVLGGAAYYSRYHFHSSKVYVDPVDAESLEHRAVGVTEIGATVGRLAESFMWMGPVMLGINTKLQLFQTYEYHEAIDTASLELDKNKASYNGSSLNFDIGITRERGVWKTSLVARDLIPQDVKYGESEDSFKVQPMVRLGVAYQSRLTFFEFDVDLTENQGVAHQENSQYAAMGAEWQVLPGFYTRLGFKQNLVGKNDSHFTLGIGLNYFSMFLDFGFTFSSEDDGSFAQFGFKM